MVKRILLSIVMLMLIAYLGIAITAFNRKPADQTCRDVELVIKDTTYAGLALLADSVAATPLGMPVPYSSGCLLADLLAP